MESREEQLSEKVEAFFDENNVPDCHGAEHALKVTLHASLACNYEKCDGNEEYIRAAALLHDVDDEKFFPNSVNYSNAAKMLEADYSPVECILILEMIGLVSCSKNGNTEVKPTWKLIPRHADRIEAIGLIGIARCYSYSRSKNRALFLPETARATNQAELAQIATKERFGAYKGSSASMIDHYYDKLLHMAIITGNEYLDTAFQQNQLVMENYVIEFGKTGKIDEKQLEELCEKMLK